LLDILVSSEDFCDASTGALEKAASAGSLVICDIVYAEFCVHFEGHRAYNAFLHDNEIRVPSLVRDAHFLASRVWRRYRAQGGKRDRILADFLIGAHSKVQAGHLPSRDRGFYRSLFPTLSILDPSA
jgi:predicted nucleic acid-binding protein